MKQLDFFFDMIRSLKTNASVFDKSTEKKLVFGGKKDMVEVLLVHGRTVKVRRKSYQRNLSLSLRPNGELSVVAAKTVPTKMIHKFVFESWSWVEQQQEKMLWLRERFPQKRFEPGEMFQILGVDHSLVVGLTKDKKASVSHSDGQLKVLLPQHWLSTGTDPRASIKIHVRNYYEELGRKILAESVFRNSQRLQLFPTSVSYRCQKTRWGSCSPSGHISLNWRLVAAPQEILDYVVIHELCHLQHANHSPAFWRVVDSACPRAKKIRAWLSENQFAFDFLNETSELHPNS